MTTRLRRDQFTDVIEHGAPYVRWCEKPIDPRSKHGDYCTDCDFLWRHLYPDTY
jgi:hypothetical protein